MNLNRIGVLSFFILGCVFFFIGWNVYFRKEMSLSNLISSNMETRVEVPCYITKSGRISEKYLDGDTFVISQDDPRLLEVIYQTILIPPARNGAKILLKDSSMGQSNKIMEILKHKIRGFFVECGALDGKTRSNTLWLEQEYGWKGLLVEADQKNVQLAKQLGRKAWLAPVCLSVTPYPKKVIFKESFNLGKITEKDPHIASPLSQNFRKTQCIPIYSLLLALNATQVDYFSLDVEGNELEVLKTIPWDFVKIATLSVEYIHGKQPKEDLRAYMEEKGYVVHSTVTNKQGLANDYIFYHPKLIAP